GAIRSKRLAQFGLPGPASVSRVGLAHLPPPPPRPSSDLDLCTAGLKAGAARHRLRRLTALTPSAHRSLGWACARQRPSGIARFVTGNIPFLAPRDHGVEDADELAHAGGERNLLLLSFGDQAIVERLEHGVVPGRSAKTSHVEEIADLAAAAFDVAGGPAVAPVVIVRRYPQPGRGRGVARLLLLPD